MCGLVDQEVVLSGGIMSTTERRSLRLRLVERLGGWASIRENTVGFEVIVDFERKGPWLPARKVWSAASGQATHHLLLQDDAWPCHDFWSVLRSVITAAPDQIITLFTIRKTVVDAADRGDHFLQVREASGVAVVMPVGIAVSFVEWSDRMVPLEIRPDDVRVSLFAEATGRRVVTTVPSIVDHRDEGVSLVKHAGGRVALVYDERIGEGREQWVMPEDLSGDNRQWRFGNVVMPLLQAGQPIPWPMPWRWTAC